MKMTQMFSVMVEILLELGGPLLWVCVIHFTVGTVKSWIPKEDDGKVKMNLSMEIDEVQLESRSDDEDT